MGIDVVDIAIHGRHRLTHAACCTFAGRCHHVVAIGGRAIAGHFGVDLRAACLGVFQLLEYQHAAAASDDEAITGLVVRARRGFRRVVVAGGQGAHGVEQAGQGPVLFFTTTGKHDVLLVQLDLFHGATDAVGRRGTGRGDRVVDTLDLERRGQTGRDGRAHGASDAVGTDATQALGAHHVCGLDLVCGGSATGTGDQAGTLVGNLLFGETGIGNRLRHGDVGIGRSIPHEAQLLAIDVVFEIDVDNAGHVATEAQLGVFLFAADTRTSFAERFQDLLAIIAQAGNNAQPGDYHSTHGSLPFRSSQWR